MCGELGCLQSSRCRAGLSHLRSTKKLKITSIRSPNARQGLRGTLHVGIVPVCSGRRNPIPTLASIQPSAAGDWARGRGCAMVAWATRPPPAYPAHAHWLLSMAPPPLLGP